MTTEGFPFVQHLIQSSPTLAIAGSLIVACRFNRGLRHDLPPIDTSQIASILGGDESVRNHQILPAILIEVDKS